MSSEVPERLHAIFRTSLGFPAQPTIVPDIETVQMSRFFCSCLCMKAGHGLMGFANLVACGGGKHWEFAFDVCLVVHWLAV